MRSKTKKQFFLFFLIISFLVINATYAITFEKRVLQSSDDAEEKVSTGYIDLISTDLELTTESEVQEIGIRFQNVTIPSGATITDSYLEFEIDEYYSETTNLVIRAEDADNPGTFTTATDNISNRITTTASTTWNAVDAPAVDAKLQSPSLNSVIQEVIDRGGWSSNNSMVFIITGTGKRTVETYDGESSAAPLLHIEYTTAPSTALTFLSFFMDSERNYANDNGPTDTNEFDECPIQLNDYGTSPEKCQLWDCTAWSAGANDKRGNYCTGGWDCTAWNGESCDTYTCSGWTQTTTDQLLKYCSGNWDCTLWNGSVCENWDCSAWSNGSNTKRDTYCSGVWDCTEWNGDTCDKWDCSSWTQSSYDKKDAYCSGLWDCTSWNGSSCDNWSCTAWETNPADDSYDVHCVGDWACSAWNGNICDSWECTNMSISGTNDYDYYCDRWQCSNWDTDKNVCQAWTCLEWIRGATIKRNYYCSGSYDCTDWRDTLGPSGLIELSSGNTTGDSQILNWDQVTETNFSHYEIWYGTNQSDVQNRTGTAVEWDNLDDSAMATIGTTSTTITGLSSGQTYYFKIWAVDNYSNESTVADINKLIITQKQLIIDNGLKVKKVQNGVKNKINN